MTEPTPESPESGAPEAHPAGAALGIGGAPQIDVASPAQAPASLLNRRAPWQDALPLFIVVLVVLGIDQFTKIMVVRNMYQGQSIPLLGDWLRLTYTENPGMAFGIEFAFPGMVTVFSIVATVLIMVYLFRVGRLYAPYRYSLALVLGGAIGNIIDRVFYGRIIYDEPLFLGRVVDFIHVNLWRGHIPDGIPLLGGNYIALFPIWNVADMAIVTGVVGILVFQRAFHQKLAEAEVDGKVVQVPA